MEEEEEEVGPLASCLVPVFPCPESLRLLFTVGGGGGTESSSDSWRLAGALRRVNSTL